MYRMLFIVLLVIHAVGDFYLLPDKFAEKKREKFSYVVYHSLIYLAASAVCIIPFWSVRLALTAATLAVAHFIIDAVIFAFTKDRKHDTVVFIIDQLLHGICIAAAVYVMSLLGEKLALLPFFRDGLKTVVSSPASVLIWVFMLVLIGRPSNIVIRKLTASHAPESITSAKLRTDGLIGILERLLTIFAMARSFYIVIGLWLIAKTIANYGRLSTEKKYAEYYIAGTLLSILAAIGIFLLVV